MKKSRAGTDLDTKALQNGTNVAHDAGHEATRRHRHAGGSGLSERLARPHSLEEAEQEYVAARDAWTAAMRRANSGRPADLAALAIAQEAYEAALAERERWQSGAKVAIAVEPEQPRRIEAVVGQEMLRRQVHEHEQEHEDDEPRGLRRLFRRKRRT